MLPHNTAVALQSPNTHSVREYDSANQGSHKEMRLLVVCQDEVDMLHASY